MKGVLLGLLVGMLVFAQLQQQVPGSTTKAELSMAGGTNYFQLSNSYSIERFPVPVNNSGPWSIAVDHRGVVWFLEETANALGSFDPASGLFEQFQIPTPHSTPTAVAVDGSGNIWFTELSSDKIAELTQGAPGLIERNVPGLPIAVGGSTQTLGCGPGAIVADMSGSIWFACLFSNQIDRFFTKNNTFASYDLPNFPSGPAGLVLDGHGNLWFTAADADMLGKLAISQVVNGTINGIDEFAPLNSTYVFSFQEQTSFLGGTVTVRSSLPTPSGIAVGPDGRLWITEHIDSSFDSYNPATGSLVRYWTSQTYGAFGFRVSFPNGIAVDREGRVWVAEHYGNRVAEFDPATDQLTEYVVSQSAYAAVYQLTLGNNETPWFVEIQGNAIAELVPRADPSPLSLSVPSLSATLGQGDSVSVPLSFAQPETASGPVGLSLKVSGTSPTGEPQNMSAEFSPNELAVPPGKTAVSNMTLVVKGLSSGTYYLTVTAATSSPDVLYSVIFKLTVSVGSQSWALTALGVGVAGVLVASVVLWGRRWGSARNKRGRCAGLSTALTPL